MIKKILLCLCAILFFCANPSQAKADLPFEGRIDFLSNEYVFTFDFGDQGSLSAQLKESKKNQFALAINVEHLKMFLLDVATQLEGMVEIDDRKKDAWEMSGKIWSQYSLINFKPAREFAGSFKIKEETLYLQPLTLGIVSVRGTIGLVDPYPLDLNVELHDVEMKDFLAFFSKEVKVDSSGFVNGKVKISGDIGAVDLKGELSSKYGFVGKLDYENISLSAEGMYPNIYISDSRITQEDGTIFSIDGSINLADTEHFKTQIETLTKSPLVNTDGTNHEWTFRRSRAKGEASTTELKYLFRKDEMKDMNGAGVDMLGVEKSIEF